VNAEDPIDLTSDPSVDDRPINGQFHSGPAEPSRAAGFDTSTRGDLDGVNWYPTYDRASVERYLSALDAERDRLRVEIEAAERRTDVAQAALGARTADLEARLGAVVLAARVELDRIDQEQSAAVAAIRVEAESQAAQIRDAAESEAAAVRDAAASLSRLAGTPDPYAVDGATPTNAPRPPGPWPFTDEQRSDSPASNGMPHPGEWTDAG
jgi:hypothetical protein